MLIHTAITVHGILERSGRDTTDKLAPYFRSAGGQSIEYDYGFKLFVSWRNDRWAQGLAHLADAQPGPVAAVGFSNGGDIALRASWLSPKIQRLVLIRPAAASDVKVAGWVDKVFVFHSPYDPALAMTPLVAWFNPKSQWGPLGKRGYVGSDSRFVNMNTAEGHPILSYTHLDFWLESRLSYFGRLVTRAAMLGHLE